MGRTCGGHVADMGRTWGARPGEAPGQQVGRGAVGDVAQRAVLLLHDGEAGAAHLAGLAGGRFAQPKRSVLRAKAGRF